jgi:hypothetical protein
MALVERLMGVDEVESDPNTHKIAVHAFFAANHQRINGDLSRAQVISMFALDAAAVAEYDTLAAQAPTGSTALATAQKAMFLERIHAVLILGEGGYAGYVTPTEVRAKLGL